MSELLEQIKMNVVQGRLDEEDEGLDGDMGGQPGVIELVEKAIATKVPPREILVDGLTAGMQDVGAKYESGEYLIPDMLAAAECVGSAMDLLEPHLLAADVEMKGKFVIATVEGDLHDIGKNIVATLLRGSGFEVRDLGVSAPADKILEAVKSNNANFVGLSAVLTTTMHHMGDTVEALDKAGLRDKVKVFIGGAPTSAEFADKIGADGHCRDAFELLHRLQEG